MKILATLVRLYLPLDQFDDAVRFYVSLLGEEPQLRFTYQLYGLELVQVGTMLLIGGSSESIEPFARTKATFLVECLDEFATGLPTMGAEILEGIREVPTGRNMLVRHPDGAIVEYVEHRPRPSR